MLSLFAAAALAAPPAPPAAGGASASRYGECGVPAAAVSVQHSRELDGDVVRVRLASASVTEPELSCLMKVAWRRGDFVRFTDPRLARRYNAAEESISEAMALARARSWLEAHGKLRSLPAFDPDRQSLAGFARSLETLCGFAPSEFFTVYGPRLLTLKPMPMGALLAREEEFACAMSAATASNLRQRGIAFGLIGNGPAPAPHAPRTRPAAAPHAGRG